MAAEDRALRVVLTAEDAEGAEERQIEENPQSIPPLCALCASAVKFSLAFTGNEG